MPTSATPGSLVAPQTTKGTPAASVDPPPVKLVVDDAMQDDDGVFDTEVFYSITNGTEDVLYLQSGNLDPTQTGIASEEEVNQLVLRYGTLITVGSTGPEGTEPPLTDIPKDAMDTDDGVFEPETYTTVTNNGTEDIYLEWGILEPGQQGEATEEELDRYPDTILTVT